MAFRTPKKCGPCCKVEQSTTAAMQENIKVPIGDSDQSRRTPRVDERLRSELKRGVYAVGESSKCTLGVEERPTCGEVCVSVYVSRRRDAEAPPVAVNSFSGGTYKIK